MATTETHGHADEQQKLTITKFTLITVVARRSATDLTGTLKILAIYISELV